MDPLLFYHSGRAKKVVAKNVAYQKIIELIPFYTAEKKSSKSFQKILCNAMMQKNKEDLHNCWDSDINCEITAH